MLVELETASSGASTLHPKTPMSSAQTAEEQDVIYEHAARDSLICRHCRERLSICLESNMYMELGEHDKHSVDMLR